MPQRIQRKRTKGWRMPEGAVHVGRPSKCGNPFDYRVTMSDDEISAAEARQFVTDAYRDRLADSDRHPGDPLYEGAPTYGEIRSELAGKDLACWCPLDQPCHADVLLEITNGSQP
ncbi:DUF4326 domain-containing protein [Rhodococcus hoagii]|nr:DUF4326 domain-containing protein [Prescottella equi]NKR75879.1 DUF4326 domain-containing protein [Prescottella equi]